MLSKWFAWVTFFFLLPCRRSIEELLKLLPGPHLDLKRVSAYYLYEKLTFVEFFFKKNFFYFCRVVRPLILHWMYTKVWGFNRVLTGKFSFSYMELFFWFPKMIEVVEENCVGLFKVYTKKVVSDLNSVFYSWNSFVV